MQTVIITLVGPARQVDLKLPAEIPVGDLFPKLLELCGPSLAQPQTAHAQWRLVMPARGLAVPPNRSLHDFGVVDGATLVLQDSASFMAQQQQQIASQSQPFRPQALKPDASTGGIGVKWNIPNR